MKRSEMITLISNFIYELNIEPYECDEVSEKLLSKIEAAGMKPPENGYDYNGYGSGDDYFCTSTPNYEWEYE